MWLIDKIVTYFRTRRHAKEYKKIQEGLLSNPELLLKTQASFEKSFGKDTGSRSRVQWQNLVRVYGMETVCKMERMTERDVNRRCSESFKAKVLRELCKN
jgi:hypothetical protein